MTPVDETDALKDLGCAIILQAADDYHTLCAAGILCGTALTEKALKGFRVQGYRTSASARQLVEYLLGDGIQRTLDIFEIRGVSADAVRDQILKP